MTKGPATPPRTPHRFVPLAGTCAAALNGPAAFAAAGGSLSADAWHWIAAVAALLIAAAAGFGFIRWRYSALKQHARELEESVRLRTGELDHRNHELAAAIRELESARERAVESERQAVAANGSKTKFLANVSHELRTPLNAIIGYAELLEEEARDRGDHALVPQLGKIRFAARHLLSLINSILDLSKIEAGKMELEVTTFELREVVDEVVTTLKPGIHRDGNRFLQSDDGNLGTMRTDPTKLRQVLYNLLSNANKFTNHGEIALDVTRTTAANGAAIFSFRVRDTGIGMTAEQINRIFQPFTQGDITMSRRYGGTGLGLAISRNLARLMGGDITVTATPGEGAEFTLTLPESVETGVSEVAP